MDLEIRGHNVAVTESIRDHIERRVDFALGRFHGRFSKVVVRLADVNGPKGGIDKRCRISVERDHARSIVVEHLDAQLESAVDQAVRRVGRVFKKELDKAHSIEFVRQPKSITDAGTDF